MSVQKKDVVAALSVHDEGSLKAILDAAQVSLRGSEGADMLAERIADALWWNYSTPSGYISGRASLDDILAYVAGRLRVPLGPGDAWAKLRGMTVYLAHTTGARIDVAEPSGVAWDDLEPTQQGRLGDAWFWATAAAGSSAASLTAGFAGQLVVRLGATPIGRILPIIPRVGPVWRTVRRAGGISAVVGGPLAIGLAAVALDQTLGTNHRKLVPLLLGVGALGPSAIVDVVEVPSPA